jgi:hypothetical protein
VYVIGVETVELDNVVVEAFRAALGNVDDCGETSVLKGLSFDAAGVGIGVGVLDLYMSIVRCCSFLKSVPAI